MKYKSLLQILRTQNNQQKERLPMMNIHYSLGTTASLLRQEFTMCVVLTDNRCDIYGHTQY